jgi:hypothetical protein
MRSDDALESLIMREGGKPLYGVDKPAKPEIHPRPPSSFRPRIN